MISFRATIILAVSIVIGQAGFSQSNDSIAEGLGIEIGFGYNNMFWRAPLSMKCPAGVIVDRTSFHLTPTVRLNYRAHLARDVVLHPIIGYAQLGGSAGSRERYSFETLEIGSFLLYELTPFSFGVGMKINRHFKIRYILGDSDSDSYADWFIKWSDDVGTRATYMFMPWSVSVEAWFGLNNLSDPNTLPQTTVRLNNYRVLLGYTI